MRKLLLVLVAVVSVATANAQTKLFSWGAEAGLNVNKLSSDLLSSSNRCGFFLGPKVFIKIPLVGLGADAALLYSLNGANATTATAIKEGELVNTTSTKNLSYLQIPVNLRYDFSFLSLLGAYLATGPQYSLCMNSSGTLAEIYGQGVNHSTWAWNVGAGLKFFNHLHLGFTYAIPISSVSAKNVLTGLTSSATQKTFTVRLAYQF